MIIRVYPVLAATSAVVNVAPAPPTTPSSARRDMNALITTLRNHVLLRRFRRQLRAVNAHTLFWDIPK